MPDDETNPYQSPEEDADYPLPDASNLDCPKCGRPMENGYLATSGRIYWRTWRNQSWVLFGSEALPGTGPGVVGINRIGGFRCEYCELVVFGYGEHKRSTA